MPLESLVKAITYVTLAAMGAAWLLLGTKALTYASLIVAAVSLVFLGFARHAWRWPLLNGLVVKHPDLTGTWRYEINSEYVDPLTASTVKKTAFAVVKQTLTSTTVLVWTDNARSESIGATIEIDRDDLFTLAVPFICKVRSEHDEPIHYGCALFEKVRRGAKEIEGRYWTERATKGTVRLSDRRPEEIGSYARGLELFGLTPSQPPHPPASPAPTTSAPAAPSPSKTPD